MIYTVTLNPSLDYYVKVNNFKTDTVNRAASERLTVGGKGVNIALQLKELGDPSVAFGFVAGFTGREISAEIRNMGVKSEFIEVEGRSRINVKIESDEETAVNGLGALVTPSDVKRLTDKLKAILHAGDFVTLGGNVPSCLGGSVYADIIAELSAVKGVNFVVDACGENLTLTLKHRPFLIKPNIFELCEVFGISTTDDKNTIAHCAEKLRQMGARNVIVSLGSGGAGMLTEDNNTLFVGAACGKTVNSVGAGDCMIAGFIHEYLLTQNHLKALKFAVATGSACAFTEGIPTKRQIENIESLMH